MQFHWLNKQNNKKLLVFFAGWSFDYKPFKFLKCSNYDVLFVYDYNEISDLPDLNIYQNKFLIAWSMGVYIAHCMRDVLCDFDKKIAVNGTPYPVDNEFGIPQKPFLLTLRHARVGLEGKFYQNIFNKTEELEKYIQNAVERDLENRVSELQVLYDKIQNSPKVYEKFFDKAYVSMFDKIIPPKNQINFWQTYNTEFQKLESGHFPYYNFVSWKDLL